MLTLFRKNDCSDCDTVEESLAELSLARQVIDVSSGNETAFGLPEGAELPVLVDDSEMIVGSSAIHEHLDRLKEFKGQWDQFQSDVCYCDQKGEII